MSLDSCSMTPPVSPFGIQFDDDFQETAHKIPCLEEDANFPVLFKCAGQLSVCNKELKKDSYIRSGHLERLLNGSEHASPEMSSTLCQLFGFSFVPQLALSEQMDTLFMFLRKSISAIQGGSTSQFPTFSNQGNSSQLFEVRNQIGIFMEYVNFFLLKFCQESGEEMFLNQLTSQILTTLLYLGRMSELSSQVLQQINQVNSQAYHIFHFHLDMYWSVIQVLHIIMTKFPDFSCGQKLTRCIVDDVDTTVLSQAMQLIVWDLVSLANNEFSKVSLSDCHKTPPFTCLCVKEFWVMIYHLMHYRHVQYTEESFWISLHHVIQGITLLEDQDETHQMQEETDSNVFVNPPSINVSNGTGFCLWLMVHVTPLLGIDVRGQCSDMVVMPSNYYDVQTLLKKYLVKNNLNETELRTYLRCCIKLSDMWEPNTSLLVLLWDHFYRRLNINFHVTTVGSVSGLANVCKSSLELLDQCRRWSTDITGGIEKDNSFQLFLRLLSSNLSRLLKISNREWKQMKGRFYSKFHQRRMQELTENGLYNFTCMFLTLALTTDLEDVSSKLCDFYDMLDLSCLATGKRTVMWKGAFALMMVYVQRGIDIGFLAEKLARSFHAVCRDFANTALDSSRRHGLWTLITLYLDSVQDLFDSSCTLAHSEHKLIAFQNLFSGCRQNELQKVLSVIQSIITKFRIVKFSLLETHQERNTMSHAQGKELAEAIVDEVYKFVKSHVTTLTPPTSLADVAAGLSLLMMDFSVRVGKEDFLSSFLFFSAGENVNVSISCRYLNQILSEETVLNKLSVDLNSQIRLIQVWFRCCVYIPASSVQLTAINSVMMKVDEVMKVFQQYDFDATHSMDTAHLHFIKALGCKYCMTENWMERIQLRDKAMQYFRDLPKHISPVVRNLGPSEALHTAYSVTGQLVRHCAPLLFVQSKVDCPLPKIIDMMVVPHMMFNPDKSISPTFLGVVRETLHLFVQGLSKLDYRKVPYVLRRLKDIVTIYLQKFTIKSSGPLGISAAVHVHPLVTSLKESFGKNYPPEAAQFRNFMLELVCEQFLAVKNFKLPGNHMMGLSYLTEVLQRTVSTEIIARDGVIILFVVMEYLLLSDSNTIQQHTLIMLQHVLQACKKHPTVVCRSTLCDIGNKFVSTYNKFQFEGVLRVLEKVAVLDCELICDMVPHVTQCVHDIEVKRGVGVDQKLRQKYANVLRLIGHRGEEEIQKISEKSHCQVEDLC